MKIMSQVKTIVDEKGNKTGVIMSIANFKKLMSNLEDLQDVYVAYKRSLKKEKSVPFDKVMKDLFGNVGK